MKKVIVTGAAGFVGRHSLIPLLDRGFEIHAFDLRDLKDEFPLVNWYQIDLNDQHAVNEKLSSIGATHLLHFAWFTGHGEYWSSKENFKSLFNSFEFLRSFAANGGKRVVMSGTCAEYAWNGEICNETNSTTLPTTVYGQCKLAMFNLLKAFAQAHNLSAAWGRLFFLFGSHENPKRFVASLIQSLLKGEEAPCSHGRQIRDFMDTRDAADAFITLLDSEIQGAVNIASGQAISLKEIALMLEKLTGQTDKVKPGALPAAPNDPDRIIADTTRLNDELNWRPNASLEQRLQQTVEWWRQNQEKTNENQH